MTAEAIAEMKETTQFIPPVEVCRNTSSFLAGNMHDGAGKTTEQLKGVKSPDMKIACGCSSSMWSLVCSESPCNAITHLQTM